MKSLFQALCLSCVFSLFLYGCSNQPTQTARFCDDSGCSERSINSQSADFKQPNGPSAEFVQLEALASNNPNAAYDVALRYFRGDGVKRNSYQALQWMRQAAEGGLLEAQKALGGFYLTGLEEMGSDPQEASKWLSMAAAQGDKESAELLAVALQGKQAAETDYLEHKRWREIYRSYWYHGYSYYGRWHHNYWHY